MAQVLRLHIIAIATAAALCFGWLLTGRTPWLAALACALDWLVVNLANRVADIEEDRKNGVAGTDFVARHARALTAACALLVAASLPALHFTGLTPLRLAFHALGLAYNYRVLPGRRRFKETYLWKNASSAALFVLSCLLYPAALAGWDVSWARLAWLAAFFFPLEMTYEIIYDLRDVEGDRAQGVRTFPVVHGPRAAWRIVEALIAASAAALVAGWLSGALRVRELLLLAAPVQQALLFELRIKRSVTQRDCIALTWLGAAQVFSYLLWAWAGLPLGPG